MGRGWFVGGVICCSARKDKGASTSPPEYQSDKLAERLLAVAPSSKEQSPPLSKGVSRVSVRSQTHSQPKEMINP